MALLTHVVKYHYEPCTGCRLCDIVCPSGAIHIADRKAVIADERCIGCGQCVDKCPEDIMWMEERPEPLPLAVEPGGDMAPDVWEQSVALCDKAGLPPGAGSCACGPVFNLHIAASIVMGAETIEDVAVMTGVRGGCGIYCVAPTLRLLKAAGRDMTQPRHHRWYDMTLCLSDLDGSDHDGAVGTWIAEDLDAYQMRPNKQAEEA